MKTIILRATLAIMLCTIAVKGLAQDEYIINENFSGLTNAVLVNNNIPESLQEWDFSEYCKGTIIKGNISNIALKIEGSSTTTPYYKGYAITKPLHFEGDVFLSFIHAKTNSNDTNVKMSLVIMNGGKFADDNSESKSLNVTKHIGDATATAESFTIVNVTNDTKIKFETPDKKFFAIDDVIVTKIPFINISETSSNANINQNATKTVTVNTVRTLTGGIWNTLCLPFSVTMSDMEQALGMGQDIQLRTFTGYADNVMAFTPATEIPAGTPFLIKLNTTVVNPTFHAVTISDTPASTITYDDVSFVGTYSPVDLETDGTELFITKNNTLAIPAATTNTMNGMRAYIKVPDNFNPSATRLAIDEPTAIATFNADKPDHSATAVVYDLNGRHASHPGHGLYIVDGRLTFVKQ